MRVIFVIIEFRKTLDIISSLSVRPKSLYPKGFPTQDCKYISNSVGRSQFEKVHLL